MSEPKGHIGGTDVAAVVGVHPYKSPADVWLRIMRGIRTQAGEAAEWGNRLEAAVAQKFSDRHGVTLRPAPLLTHPKGRVWSRLRLDFEVVQHPAEAVEVKTCGERVRHRWGAPGTDEIPIEYLCQIQIELEATDRDVMHVPVLVAGQQYREYRVLHDPEASGRLIEACERFWVDFVLTGKPPPGVVNPKLQRMFLEQLHPQALEPPREATPDEVQLVRELEAIKDHERSLKERKAAAEDRLRGVIKDAAGLKGDWGKVSWTTVPDSTAIDYEALAWALAKRAGLDRTEVLRLADQHRKTTRRSYRRLSSRLRGEEQSP